MIELRGVTKAYGPLVVLDGVDLHLAQGRVTAVVGPNASGKTTIIKSILGLVRPDGGEILVGGTPVGRSPEYRKAIGYMPQIVRFPGNLTGAEITRLLQDLRDCEADEDTDLVEAFDLLADLDRPLRTLSGGTRQKVNATIAFRFGAPMMILDEPTAGLDPVASEVLREKIIRERQAGRTFLITSHDMAHLEAVADDVAFLLNGQVRFTGSVSDLKSATGEHRLQPAIAALMRRREVA